MVQNPSEHMVRIRSSECDRDFQSRENFEMHFIQQHGVDVGAIVHFAYLEERITAL